MVVCGNVNDAGFLKKHPKSISHAMAPRPQSVANVTPKNGSGSIATNRSDSSLKGFRLQDDTGSVYSLYKQKIDSMFSDSASVAADATAAAEQSSYKYQKQINNCVQARIEKMFSDISKDVDQRLNEIGSHSFGVDYLGSIPLTQKVTSLAGLQDPLKELYFAYRKNLKHKETPTGCLEISSAGLKVRYKGDRGDLEQLNTFPTIAVWSAVKFVLQTGGRGTGIVDEYAFLPLITDPDSIDKKVLYNRLESSEKRYITKDAHSPLFTVVMRKIGVAKQLECHAFVCQTSEDAIVIAATLYKSLMAYMRKKNKEKFPKNRNGISCMSVASSDLKSIVEGARNGTPVRPPRKKRSTASSVASADREIFTRATPKAPPSMPIGQDLDAIVPYPDSSTGGGYAEIENQKKADNNSSSGSNSLVRDFNEGQKKNIGIELYSNRSKQINDEIMQVFATNERGFERAHSIRKSDKENGITSENSGDILTKVTIPRSGSFLNAKGLTKYKSITSRNGQASGGSPIGFNELFNEFRQQEGLTSLDEILGAIIDSEGMSFNDLKPIYKEFLLKLAVTLTKDELYQRSKSIMRRQKKKLLRKNSSVQNKRKKMFVGGKGLRKMFRRHIGVKFTQRFRSSKNSTDNKSTLRRRHSFDFVAGQKLSAHVSSVSTTSSSYDTRQFRPKEMTNRIVNNRKQNYRRREQQDGGVSSSRDKISTSEESDFLSLQRTRQKIIDNCCTGPNGNAQNRNSSSGYVSCSECSYDSDTCTCVSADKCYCSLGNKSDTLTKSGAAPSSRLPDAKNSCYCCATNDKTSVENSFSWCGCDTDSCSDSNKCYCRTDRLAHKTSGSGGGTIFEQLRERGFFPSCEASPVTPPHRRKLCKQSSTTKSSKSLEYLRNPEDKVTTTTTTYYESIGSKQARNKCRYNADNLALDYELFTVSKDGKRIPPFSHATSVCGDRLLRSGLASAAETGRRPSAAAAVPTGRNNNEALSVKKSAEIAALFADVKLSQTTDITDLLTSDCESLVSNRPNGRGSKVVPFDLYSKPIGSVASRISSASRASRGDGTRKQSRHNSLYSARNGLYTIQSQSDDSHRSGSGGGAGEKRADAREYFNIEPDYVPAKNSVSCTLENSLGYLP